MKNANLLMIGESYISTKKSFMGMGRRVSEPLIALYYLIEERYQLKDDYKVGFESTKPECYPSEDYYAMDLHSLMEDWVKRAPICGYYHHEQVSIDDLKSGDLLAINLNKNPDRWVAVRYSIPSYLFFNGRGQFVPVTDSELNKPLTLTPSLSKTLQAAQDEGESRIVRLVRQDDHILREMIKASRGVA